jgi:hypothetical protein
LNQALSQCPVCNEPLAVTRLYCRGCDTTIEGRFRPGAFAQLSPEQLAFVETFVRCEGKFTRMESELGLSYPTLRGRLYDVIRAMGYEPRADEPPAGPDSAARQQVLTALEQGEIDVEAALQSLRGGKA